ncbi:MAG TPA: alanine racemase [bacterium]
MDSYSHKTHPISLAEVVTAESMRPHRPTFARVDRAALAANFQAFRNLAKGAKIMAVLKADAYGHGLLGCSRIFSELGVDYLGVAFVEEGIALRRAGFSEPILVLGGIVGTQIALFLDYDLDMTASSVFKIEAINEAAKGTGKRGRVHIKIDTGMNRIGQNWRTVDELFAAVHRCDRVEVAGIYSHLATAEDADTTFAKVQIARFKEALEKARAAGVEPGLRHIVNSAGAIQFPEAHFDMIRPGLGLYGTHASPDLAPRFPLTPAMSLVSEIVYMKRVRKGEGVSYGLRWSAPEDVWVATVPVGYGDGYPRLLSGSPVLIGGKRYPIVGTVCMDQLMVNLGQDRCRVGTEVVMWGRQGDAEITLWELCKPAGFIPYELPIYLTGRVPRVFG